MVSSQIHGKDWVQFENDILQPFLTRHPAVNAWLDPQCLLIAPMGAPPLDVSNAIANIAVKPPGGELCLLTSVLACLCTQLVLT